MGAEAPHIAIAKLRAAWDEQIRPSSRRAIAALSFAAFFAAALIGRMGTERSRMVSFGLVCAVVLLFLLRAIVIRKRQKNARHTIRSILVKTDAELGSATLRALTLSERAKTDETVGSSALADLHISRLLERAPTDRVQIRAAKSARFWSLAALGLAMGSAIVVLAEPFRVVEGLDVLAAKDGVAPLPVPWLDDVEMIAAPPEYLRRKTTVLLPFSPTDEARGTVISVRGRPTHSGRTLVLTDGVQEVPFVDDGAEGLIARWTLKETASLSIAAVFGSVRIPQADIQVVNSIADEAPSVTLKGAPRTVQLLDEPSVPIHYEATDDHGLREVNLVLRSGAREERRVLSKPVGETKSDRGGYEIKASDPFLKRTYAPVEVTVQARDNDPVSGPKWGKSEAIVLVPPQVGEPEALRYAALRRIRDALTDLLAERMDIKAPGTKDKTEHKQLEQAAQDKVFSVVESVMSESFGGLRVRGRSAMLLRGQLERLKKALDEEQKSPTREKHEALVLATESVLLAVDSGLRGLGFADARTVARRLGDAAEELGTAFLERASAEDPKSANARIDAATSVLSGGGRQLLKLGELGSDLGEIVENDLRRVARARSAGDFFHAELAARDLAARLRKPDPSFGGGGRGGVESGGSPSPNPGEASDADSEMGAGEQELEELARDHAAEMNEVADALEKAISKEEMEALKEEAKKHADAIREAIKNLPRSGDDSPSARDAAAAGRQQAESMAGALEQGNPKDAVQNGKNAADSLKEARRRANESNGFFSEEGIGREADKARETIERELAWAEQALEQLRRAASERAKEELERSSKDEQSLADRGRRLMEKGQSGERSLPQDMADKLSEAEQAMREAEKALKEGKGEDGLRHQQNAQRLLEMAKGERSEERNRDGNQESPDGRMSKDTEIPGKEKHKGPEDFRRRVMKGLGKASDPVLKEAVKRYAEGLLR